MREPTRRCGAAPSSRRRVLQLTVDDAVLVPSSRRVLQNSRTFPSVRDDDDDDDSATRLHAHDGDEKPPPPREYEWTNTNQVSDGVSHQDLVSEPLKSTSNGRPSPPTSCSGARPPPQSRGATRASRLVMACRVRISSLNHSKVTVGPWRSTGLKVSDGVVSHQDLVFLTTKK